MPIRYTNKYAIYQFCYHEYGMLKSEAVKVKITDVIDHITKCDRITAITLLNNKYNLPLYTNIQNVNSRIEAGVYGMDMMETIVDTISPLIGV